MSVVLSAVFLLLCWLSLNLWVGHMYGTFPLWYVGDEHIWCRIVCVCGIAVWCGMVWDDVSNRIINGPCRCWYAMVSSSPVSTCHFVVCFTEGCVPVCCRCLNSCNCAARPSWIRWIWTDKLHIEQSSLGSLVCKTHGRTRLQVFTAWARPMLSPHHCQNRVASFMTLPNVLSLGKKYMSQKMTSV